MNSILIVEDEPILLHALEETFKAKDYSVETAQDGAEGLDKALKRQPHIILLDLMLPVMSGSTVIEKLRNDPWGQHVPILVLTNNSSITSIADTIAKGSYEYLLKTDWKLEDIAAKVEATLLDTYKAKAQSKV